MGVASRAPESPIEEALVHELRRVAQLEAHDSDREIEVRGQVALGPYRADFVLIERMPPGFAGYPNGIDIRLVVECDGHQWHERTKEQARRDRRRDREMLAAGYAVVRFTGSEIYADAYGCAMEAMETLLALAEGYAWDPWAK